MASSHLRLGDLDVLRGEEQDAAERYLLALTLGQEIEAQGIVLTALTNLAAYLLKRGDPDTAITTLHIIAKQPTISDSLQQSVTDLLQQTQVQVKVEEGDLETAVATIRKIFQ